MSQATRVYQYDFRGHHLFPLTASGVGSAFTIADTSTVGAPTIKGADGGGVALTLAATSEIENICLYMGDVLPFSIADIIRVEFIAKLSAAIASTVFQGMSVSLTTCMPEAAPGLPANATW